MQFLKLLLLFIALFIQVEANTLNSNIKFEIRSDFPKQNIWIKKLLRDSNKELNKLFGHEKATIPKNILVTIKKDMRLKSIRGNARRSDNSINFSSNLWQKDKFRIWIMVHELVNLLVSHYGSNEYPSDWWANGRSPFPVYAAYLVMKNLGYHREARWLLDQNKHIPDQKFFLQLHQQHGAKLFKKFFYLMKLYNVKIEDVSDAPWPSPDKKRSLVTLSLLSMAANKNLAPLAKRYKIGQKPKDWVKRHPSIKFKTYSISKEEIEQTIGSIYLGSFK